MHRQPPPHSEEPPPAAVGAVVASGGEGDPAGLAPIDERAAPDRRAPRHRLRRGPRAIIEAARRHARRSTPHGGSVLRERLAFTGRLAAGLVILSARHLLPGALLMNSRRALSGLLAELPAVLERLSLKAGSLGRLGAKAILVLKKGLPWLGKGGWKWAVAGVKGVWLIPGLLIAVAVGVFFWLRRRARRALHHGNEPAAAPEARP